MAREDRVKLLFIPSLGSMSVLIDRLRSLPWPSPVQRLTSRGLRRLRERFPDLSAFLDGRIEQSNRPVDAPPPPLSADVALADLLAQLKGRDYEARVRAARALANHRAPEATSALIVALQDRSVEVGVAAATALAMAAQEQGRAALLDVLTNAEGFYHPLTRAAAVRGLSVLLVGEQRAPLHRALRDLDAEVSIAAIAALSAEPGHEGQDTLIRVLENTDGFYLPISRLAAARALERLPPVEGLNYESLKAREGDALVGEALTRLIDRLRTSAVHA